MWHKAHRRGRWMVQLDSAIVLPRGHIGATWRIQLNLCILRPTGVHNPKGKSIGSAVLVFTLQWVPLSTKIAPPMGDLDLMMPWAHVVPQPKGLLDRFNCVCTDDHRVSLYFTMVRPFPLQKLPLLMGICSLGPPESWTKRQLDWFSCFAGLTH